MCINLHLQFDKVEDLFKINIHIYTQDDKEHAEIDRRNKGKYDKDLYLLRYNNHFCLIICKILNIFELMFFYSK